MSVNFFVDAGVLS